MIAPSNVSVRSVLTITASAIRMTTPPIPSASKGAVREVAGHMGGQSRAASYDPQPMRSPARRASYASAAVIGVLAIAWPLPFLAPMLVWPFLLLAPGWGILAALRPRIDLAGRVGLAIVISVAV